MKTFSRFLEEAKAAKSDALRTIVRNWERRPGHKGLNVYVTKTRSPENEPHMKVHDLFVPTPLRGKGIGGRVMKGLTNYADRQGSTMSLIQSPAKGYKKKLSDFYRSHGFVPNKGRNRSLVTTDTHIRYPRSDSK